MEEKSLVASYIKLTFAQKVFCTKTHFQNYCVNPFNGQQQFINIMKFRRLYKCVNFGAQEFRSDLNGQFIFGKSVGRRKLLASQSPKHHQRIRCSMLLTQYIIIIILCRVSYKYICISTTVSNRDLGFKNEQVNKPTLNPLLLSFVIVLYLLYDLILNEK